MILNALGQVLGEAAGLILCPLPIAAVILMLFTGRWKLNSFAFLAGWITALAIIGAIVLTVSDAASVSTDSDASDGSGGVLVVLGVLCLILAVRNWRKRPKHGETPEPPKWMARIEGVGPLTAFGLAVVLSAVNPKNLLLAASAAATVGQLGLSAEDTTITWAIFVLLSSLGLLVPVVYRLLRGENAKATLDGAKLWLETHNAVVLAVIFFVIGAKILGNGLSTLS